MLAKAGFALVCILGVSLYVECRSVGEPVGVNSPDQANYQEYAEQQEYVERQVRDVQDRPERYSPKKYARSSRDNPDGVKNVHESAYQSRENGDEDLEGAPIEQVAVDRSEMEERDEKKDDDPVEAEVADQRLRQGSNEVQGDAGYRRPRENVDADSQEQVRMTEAARPEPADAEYDAMNAPPSETVKEDDSAYLANNYVNYDYAPEQEAQGPQNIENVAPANEEGAAQPQSEQAN